MDKNQRSVFSFLDLSFDYNNNKWVLLESQKKDDNVLILSDEYQELKSTKIQSKDQVIEFKYLNNKDEFDFDSIFQNVQPTKWPNVAASEHVQPTKRGNEDGKQKLTSNDADTCFGWCISIHFQILK